MGNIKGIIFDYGGTIDSRGDHWSEVIWEGYGNSAVKIDKEVFRRAYVETEREFARTPVITPADTFREVMSKKITAQMRYLVQWEAVDNATALKAADIAAYCYQKAAESVAEALPVIKRLHEKYPLVLVSNFYGNVEAVLTDFNLRQYFNAVVESAVVGVRKPDPAIFALGVDALGLKPSEVLVVGDSYRKDILPARSIGCATAWIKGKGWTPEEDAQTDDCQIANIESLTEMLL